MKTKKPSTRCSHRTTKMSGRGGFPSMWKVQCSKKRVPGRAYCELHAAARDLNRSRPIVVPTVPLFDLKLNPVQLHAFDCGCIIDHRPSGPIFYVALCADHARELGNP